MDSPIFIELMDLNMRYHSDQEEDLYFIGIVPGERLKEEIRLLKEEVREKYSVRHALKSPAHITLQMPFKRPGREEQEVIHILEKFAEKCLPFKVELSGFGCFRPRVIFIRVTDPGPLKALHSDLVPVLKEELHFNEKETMASIIPHITIATRDLDPGMFPVIWNDYEKRSFHGSFDVTGIFLFKHNGRFWDIFREFKFSNQDVPGISQ